LPTAHANARPGRIARQVIARLLLADVAALVEPLLAAVGVGAVVFAIWSATLPVR